MTVPAGAIGQASGQDFVWAIEKGALVRRIVVTGRRDPASGRVEVVKGLGADAEILAMRFDNLKEGAPAGSSRSAASPTAPVGVGAGRIVAVGVGVGRAARGALLTRAGRAMWFTRVSINNPVFATMVMAALCVLGLFSYSQLRVERLPDITPPIVFVAVAYPGASPEAVETELTRPIELSLNGIAGVKMIRSNSLEGRSETVVEFQVSADMNRAVQDVRDKVAAVQPNFPRDAKQPYVSRFDGDNAQPTVYLSLLGQERSARELSLLADQVVKKRLERATGVARVDVGGLTVRQVRIDLDPQRLRALQLTPGDVSTALQRANADMPVGLLTGTKEDAIVRVEGKVKDAKALRRHRRRDAQRQRHPPRRPRHAGRARARARARSRATTACRRSRSRSSSSRTPTSSRPARRSRPRPRSCGRPCRRASSCGWSTPTATGSRARSRA